MGSAAYSRTTTAVARLEYGADLMDAIVQVAQEHGPTIGSFRAIGALQRGRRPSGISSRPTPAIAPTT